MEWEKIQSNLYRSKVSTSDYILTNYKLDSIWRFSSVGYSIQQSE